MSVSIVGCLQASKYFQILLTPLVVILMKKKTQKWAYSGPI